MSDLALNLAAVEAAIVAACERAGRKREEIELMAVSKTYAAPVLAEAAKLGLNLFGENRVQEWQSKAAEFAALKTEATQTHLIGHLQSNKAARAVELFDGIDSIDSLKLAERVNEAAGKLGKKIPILIEVKLSTEETKAGLDPESADASALLERLGSFENLIPQGLMTIAPFNVPEAETRACFRALREWRDRWAALYPELGWSVLSMGMSGDFAIAIEEGATRIRIGTAIFGKRSAAVGAQLDVEDAK
jgi:hypothetical protein